MLIFFLLSYCSRKIVLFKFGTVLCLNKLLNFTCSTDEITIFKFTTTAFTFGIRNVTKFRGFLFLNKLHRGAFASRFETLNCFFSQDWDEKNPYCSLNFDCAWNCLFTGARSMWLMVLLFVGFSERFEKKKEREIEPVITLQNNRTKSNNWNYDNTKNFDKQK